jgi:hypothetical protein
VVPSLWTLKWIGVCPLKSAGMSFSSMNDEARMSNDEIPNYEDIGSRSRTPVWTTLLLKLCFSSAAVFHFLPSLALRVRLFPTGKEDEMERRVNASAGRWTTLNSYHSERGATSFSLGREG